MDMAVGVRRAVMKDIKRPVCGCLLDLGVEIFLFPLAQEFRFPLGKICLHLEFRLGQVKRRPVVHKISPYPTVTRGKIR